MYMDGLHRSWSKRDKESYYQKELELIGQQETVNSEIYMDGTGDDGETFGFNDRYSEYRRHPSGVSGNFRSTLNYWHLARSFGSRPVLNQEFIECDPSKRIFAEQEEDSMWCMVNNSIQCRRMLTKKSIGRII